VPPCTPDSGPESSRDETRLGAAVVPFLLTAAAGASKSRRLSWPPAPTNSAYSVAVADVRAEVRQVVLAELIDLATRNAAQHQELHHSAIQAHRDDMAQRALSNQNAWLEVARVLRLEMGLGER
jgi:hypothetical protein